MATVLRPFANRFRSSRNLPAIHRTPLAAKKHSA